MTDSDFTISVVIPAYNIQDYIARAIDSVLAQTHPPDEIIVVDDGSTDNTSEVIATYGDKVRCTPQENAGLAAARNTGIKAATCQCIALLDGDDEWLPDNLRLQVELLKRHPDLTWSTSNYIRCLCDTERRAPHFKITKAQSLLGGKDTFDDFFDAFRAEAHGNSNTVIIRRTALIEAGLFREGMPFAEDIDMWFRLAMRHPRIGYVPQPGSIYHLHRPGSLAVDTHPEKKLMVISDLVERSLALAREFNRQDKFHPCATFYMRRIIRANLFYKQMAGPIRNMLDQFDPLFSVPYKTMIRLLTTFPALTAGACHTISKLVRFFNLRRRVVRPPQK
ncbi:MAG: glycosyltransferase family 2 protein [Sedimentisphaerales bacterium]|nr:glycosyltransferase family 2 protein [Sedimentisphaerales bacterium]